MAAEKSYKRWNWNSFIFPIASQSVKPITLNTSFLKYQYCRHIYKLKYLIIVSTLYLKKTRFHITKRSGMYFLQLQPLHEVWYLASSWHADCVIWLSNNYGKVPKCTNSGDICFKGKYYNRISQIFYSEHHESKVLWFMFQMLDI